jgi:Domain of unknown function (DUF4397)
MKNTLLKSLGLFLLATAGFFITSCNPDDTTPAVKEYGKVMLVHAAPSAPAVDIYVDATKSNTSTLSYTQNSGYFQVEAGATARKIVTKTVTGATVDSVNIKINKDVGYSYFAYIDNDAPKTARVLAATDNLAAPTAGKGKVRLIHLISDIPGNIAIDVEAVAPGGVSTARNDFTNVKFKDIKDFIEIAKGTYDLKIKQTGTTSVILTVPSVTITDGKIYTLIANGFATKLNTDPQGPKVTTILNN